MHKVLLKNKNDKYVYEIINNNLPHVLQIL